MDQNYQIQIPQTIFNFINFTQKHINFNTNDRIYIDKIDIKNIIEWKKILNIFVIN